MSSIDIALIAPGALTERYGEGRRFQMALAGNLADVSQVAYHEFYNQAWKPWGAEWLLDNGAWEGKLLGDDELIQIARRYRATEVMAPDVINDAAATLGKTLEFLDQWREQRDRHVVMPRVAAVAHGSTTREAMAFVYEIEKAPEVKTIAIGRAYSRKVGNPTARYELAMEIKKRFGQRFQIHLLGFSDEWPTELQHCNGVPGLIRSCDTVAPFTYAYYGYPLEAAGVAKAPRPDNYFDLTLNDINRSLLERNIAEIDKMAQSENWRRS
jgi:hypothetical protein